jgi:hypothetical protein
MLESTLTFNGLTLNDQSKRSLVVAPYYWFRVTSVDGIWDQDVRFDTHDLPHRHGAASGDAFYTGKTIVIAGQIYARNLTYLRQAQRALQAAFWDMEPYPLVFTLWDEAQLYITCRKNQKIDMPETQDRGGSMPYVRPFTVQLYADDPRMYTVAGNVAYPIYTAP